jgi:hypothetical protein
MKFANSAYKNDHRDIALMPQFYYKLNLKVSRKRGLKFFLISATL